MDFEGATELRADQNPTNAPGAPAATLNVISGRNEGKSIECRRAVTLIGSHPGCKVVLKHALIAPVHVAMINDGSRIYAADLVSKHSPLLNGLKLDFEAVSDGDRLTIRPWEFQVDVDSGAASGASDSGHPNLKMEPTPEAVALEHVASNRLLQLNRNICIIGRRQGCDIALGDNEVSRVHAIIVKYYGHPAIFDLLSKNHTFVNDEMVTFRLLTDGDVITVGETKFRVRLAESNVGKKASRKKADITPITLVPQDTPPDLIDIAETEGSQRWVIAEKAEKAAQAR